MELSMNIGRATRLIQVNLLFRPKDSLVTGSFHIWKKAGDFGFGDELMYWCPAHGCTGLHSMSFELTEAEQQAIHDIDNIALWPASIKIKHDNWFGQMVTCPKCEHTCTREALCDSYHFNTSFDRIAIIMHQLWRELNGDADIYMVRTKESKAFKQSKALIKSKMFNKEEYDSLIEKGRDRDQVFYKLADILKDTVGGNTVESCFLGLLRS